jgi:putative FmdB family regulatory protein
LVFVPTYEYQCTGCGREFEVRQRISEAPLTVCETCGGALKRLLSAAPFILKGAGWYVTDYPSESRKKALESEKSSAGPAKKEATTKEATTKETTTKETTTSSSSSSETSSSSTSASPAPTSGSAGPAKTSSSSD